VIRQTAECRNWMRAHGVRFQPSLGGTLHLSRTNAFFLGGGKALLNGYYRAAEALGIEIEYNAEVNDLNFRDGQFHSANVVRKGFTEQIRAKALIAASGGFQGNLEWLRSAWGEAANNFLIRGTSYDNGLILRLLMERGALTVADPTQGHCVAIDARAPKFDGGIITRVDCVSLGITLNRDCQRFYDEGEDFWPKRYAIWGRLVAQQPGQIAYTIIDSQAMGAFMPPVFPPVQARTLRELAEALKLDPQAMERTVAEYNAAVRPGEFNHSVLDNCRTEGLAIPKSHWARRIERAPFYAYPLRPGLTFTYLGVKVDERSRVCFDDAKKFDNVFAAGEIMAGNIMGKGYLAGLGMAIGTVFGRIAGKEAAQRARS
jgi:tricarballylate dehydrogenase